MSLDTHFTRSGHYTFDFTSTGFFTLVNAQGEPLYEQALPFFEKMISHLVWIFFWLVLILVNHTLFSSWMADYILMSLIFTHLFLFGCRLTTILMKKALAPILFPPLWVRLTRKLQKGQGIELLKKHNLHEHPGLLANLALVQYLRHQQTEASHTIRQAYSLAPHHPLLSELIRRI